MHYEKLTVAALVGFGGLAGQASADVDLGSAEPFGVLAATTVTNTGLTVVNGDLGVWPGTAITGFPPGVVNGTMHPGDGVAEQAQLDAALAYNDLEGRAPNQDLTGMDLGGMTLMPGVYSFSSSAFLTGTLTLDAMGDPNAEFVFQIGSTLVSASDSEVILINAPDDWCDLYWQVGSSATLGTGTAFQGSILALTSITMTTGASLNEGQAIALNGAVTMDTNLVTPWIIPSPATASLLGLGLGGVAARRRR